FHYRNNPEFINESIAAYGLADCMIICPNELSVEDADFRALVQSDAIQSINVEDPGRNRALHRFLSGLNKNYIRLDDLFEKQARNSDFLEIEEHRFSEEHLYYQDENFSGFCDYTTLPSEYTDGGSTPR